MAEPGVGVGLGRVGLCRSPALQLSVIISYGHAERRNKSEEAKVLGPYGS